MNKKNSLFGRTIGFCSALAAVIACLFLVVMMGILNACSQKKNRINL